MIVIIGIIYKAWSGSNALFGMAASSWTSVQWKNTTFLERKAIFLRHHCTNGKDLNLIDSTYTPALVHLEAPVTPEPLSYVIVLSTAHEACAWIEIVGASSQMVVQHLRRIAGSRGRPTGALALTAPRSRQPWHTNGSTLVFLWE